MFDQGYVTVNPDGFRIEVSRRIESIAVDQRIKKVSKALGVRFPSYDAAEQFYLSVAREVGLNRWELDRLLYGFTNEVLAALRASQPSTTNRHPAAQEPLAAAFDGGCLFCTPATDRVIRRLRTGVAIRDSYLVTPGHALVLPRQHVASIFDLP